jgi:hypothetical protein
MQQEEASMITLRLLLAVIIGYKIDYLYLKSCVARLGMSIKKAST